VPPDCEPRDVVGSPGMKDIKNFTIERQTDRLVPAGVDPVDQLQSIAFHREHRDLVTPGIDGVKPSLVGAQDHAALIPQPATGTKAPGGIASGRSESTRCGAVEDQDAVFHRIVSHGIDGADHIPVFSMRRFCPGREWNYHQRQGGQ